MPPENVSINDFILITYLANGPKGVLCLHLDYVDFLIFLDRVRRLLKLCNQVLCQWALATTL